MQHPINDPIDVSVVFSTGDQHRKRIEPRGFRWNGDTYSIAEVRQSYPRRVGQVLEIHFLVRTKEDRYFHLVYDSKELLWTLRMEFEDEFPGGDVEIEMGE